MILELEDISTFYGKIEALKGVSLYLEEGEIVTIIGANGAGKTTILKTICGLIHPKSGKILFRMRSIERLSPDKIVQLGISLCPEGRRIFPTLTVLENLKMGAWARNNKKEIEEDLERNFNLFPILKERINQKGGTLSGGEQQMLAIARALMSKPQALLLDEPSLGLAPKMVEKIFEVIKEINQEGVSILLVEQNANLALRIANRGYVLETGRFILIDYGYKLIEKEKVKSAYLGG
ncbi:TPA: ABC transporter ATP-binding protein [bacterium]|nr:ABC transporter ATP-binding protein [bacterium]